MKRGKLVLVLAGAVLSIYPAVRVAAQMAGPGLDVKGLPAGWQASALGADVGADRIQDKQSVSVDANGVWTISAGGFDLWNDTDGGLIVYTNHTGDGRVSFRMLSQTGGHDDGWVKTAAGMRESLAAGSRDVHISYTSANALEPAVRLEANATPRHPGEHSEEAAGPGLYGNGGDDRPTAGRQLGDPPVPIWIGVDRQGNNFGYYYSEDGNIWVRLASTDLELPAQVLAGIEASAHKDTTDDQTAIPNQVSMLDNVTVNNELLRARAVTNIQFKAGSQSALVSWTPISAQVGGDVTYNVYQINPNGTERTKVNTDPIKESSFNVTGLTNGTEYRFAVTAVVNGKESPLAFALGPADNLSPSVTPG